MATLIIDGVSRGIGGLQRRVLDALIQRRDNDSYNTEHVARLQYPTPPPAEIRARWRWYTIDLLGLVEVGAPRSERVSLHRAVRGLHRREHVDISSPCPYAQRYGAYESDEELWWRQEYDDYEDHEEVVGGFDLSELSDIDPRWHSGAGRSLWFRLRMPINEDPPDDDEVFIEDIVASDSFVEFSETLDRQEAWNTEIGRFLRWLFCGSAPEELRGT